MKASQIKQNNHYWYKAPYGKDWQIYQCVGIYFNESQDQYIGTFECMTDTYFCNSIGSIYKLNEIEMERYLDDITDLHSAFKCFKSHQKKQ
jgi:hypothetical protein